MIQILTNVLYLFFHYQGTCGYCIIVKYCHNIMDTQYCIHSGLKDSVCCPSTVCFFASTNNSTPFRFS